MSTSAQSAAVLSSQLSIPFNRFFLLSFQCFLRSLLLLQDIWTPLEPAPLPDPALPSLDRVWECLKPWESPRWAVGVSQRPGPIPGASPHLILLPAAAVAQPALAGEAQGLQSVEAELPRLHGDPAPAQRGPSRSQESLRAEPVPSRPFRPAMAASASCRAGGAVAAP